MRKLNYQCPRCGTPLGYEGLCWLCQSEVDREEIAAYTEAEVESEINRVIDDIKNLEDFGDTYERFWNLLSIHGIADERVARAALQEDIFALDAVYYHAPDDVTKALV